MKKLWMLLLCIVAPFLVKSQETGKLREIGLLFSNLDNFGLTFRTGNQNFPWRFNTLYFNGGMSDETGDSLSTGRSSYGASIRAGKEFRTTLSGNLALRLGADLSFAFNRSKTEYDDQSVMNYDRMSRETTYSPGFNLVFGVNYAIGRNLVVGAEVLPGVVYSAGTRVQKNYGGTWQEVTTDLSGFTFGLSNTSAMVSLVYRFAPSK